MRYRTYNPFLSCMGGLCGYQNLGIEETTDATAELRKETGLPASDQTSEPSSQIKPSIPSGGHSVLENATKRPSGILEMPPIFGTINYLLPSQIETSYAPNKDIEAAIMAQYSLIFDEGNKVIKLTSNPNTLAVWESIMSTHKIPATEWVSVAESVQRMSKSYDKSVVSADFKKPVVSDGYIEADEIVAFYAVDEGRFLVFDEPKQRFVEIETFDFEKDDDVWVEWDEATNKYTYLVDKSEIPWKTDSKGNVIWSTHKQAYYKNWADYNPLMEETITADKVKNVPKKAASKPVVKPKTPPKKKGGLPNWPLYFLGGLGVVTAIWFLYRHFKSTPAKRKKNPKKGARKPNSMTRYRISARKATKG